MSSRKAFIEALFLVSYVTGVTDTIRDYAERVALDLANGAHRRRFELAISSSKPEWHCEQMQLFAYEFNDYYWNLKNIRWGIRSDSLRMDTDKFWGAFGDAFAQWGAQIPVTFEPVSLEEEADIRISSDFLDRDKLVWVQYISEDPLLDLKGVNVIFNDLWNWNDPNRKNYRDLWFAALYIVGRVLGLGDSHDPAAIMFGDHGGFEPRQDVYLGPDDIEGIKALYRDP